MLRKILFGMPLILVTTPSLAANWQVIPSASVQGLHETNAGLVTADEQDGSSVQVTGGFEARRTTERTNIFIIPRVQATRFTDDELESLDREEYFLNGGVNHVMERAEVGLRGRFLQRPAYRSELDASIPDDPDDPLPSGNGELTVRDDRQTLWEIRPDWSLAATERDTVSVGVRYQDVSYEKSNVATGRFDFSDASVTTEWQHDLDARQGVVGALFLGEYNSENPQTGTENESQYFGGTVGYLWRASEVSTIQVNAGVTNTDQDGTGRNLCTDPEDVQAGTVCEIENSDTSFTGDVTWRTRGEQTNTLFQLSRAVRPTSNGAQQDASRAQGFVDRRLSERLSGRFGIVLTRQESLDDRSDREQDYLSAEAEMRWALTRQFSLTAGYRYISRETERTGVTTEDFSNNEFRLGIAWQALSR